MLAGICPTNQINGESVGFMTNRHAKTQRIIEAAYQVLDSEHPMTLRQVYYRLVSGQVLKNTRSQYQALSNALVAARKEELIPWTWIEDRLRRPRCVSMWENLAGFVEMAKEAYRRDVWASQPVLVECWLEKDALSGIFENLLDAYGVTLNVGRGYDGWDSIHSAAIRYGQGENVVVLYYGDFDPSGEDMVRSLRERLTFFDSRPTLIKCALTADDVTRHRLPSDYTKASDTRSGAFVERYGDMAVELDALPSDVLRERIRCDIEAHMDLAALESTRRLEENERKRFVNALNGLR